MNQHRPLRHVLHLACALALLPWSGCENPPPAPRRFQPTAVELAALTGPAGAEPVPLQLVVPAEGSVVPWTFPAIELQWEDRFRANAFLVRVRVDGVPQPLLEVFTTQRRLELAAAEWAPVRDAAGEGGAFTVELIAASLMPSGRALHGPTTVVARGRFSAAGEHPTGHVYYSQQLRPTGAPPGPSDRSHRLLFPLRVDMDGEVEPQLEGYFDEWIQPPDGSWKDVARNGWVPLGASEWAERPAEAVATRSFDYSPVSNVLNRPLWRDLYPKPQGPCMGCHLTRSNDDRYYAFTAALDDRRPGRDGDTFHTLFAVRAGDGELMAQRSYGFFPRFHPRRPALLVYSQWANEFKDGFLASVYHADLRSIDLDSGDPDGGDLAGGVEGPVPGASEPDRCEITPDWSPDGEHLVFSRSLPGEPCDGERGTLEIVRMPWNDGRGGPASVLVAADGGANAQPRWSPDGRWIVYFRAKHGYYAQGSADLWAVPAAGGTPVRLAVSTDAMESWHAFSPDGRWLAFQSNRERVDRVKGWLTRFYEDGSVSPAIPLPGAGAPTAAVTSVDWCN